MAGSFSVDIAKFVEKTKVNANVAVRKIALDLFAEIIQRTPVDTGRARGGWLVGLGSMPTGEGAADKGGAKTIAEATSKIAARNPGQDIFLINRVPYIRVLEYGMFPNPPKAGKKKTVRGFSKQAPQGMVRVSIKRTVAHIADIVRGLK